MPRSSTKSASTNVAAGSATQQTPDATAAAAAGFLQQLEKNLEDVRTVILCRVCIQPLYEPFTNECGHTFCYSCLDQWFSKDRRKKTCPACRADVVRNPAPAYLIRELTSIFTTRAELLPPGETTAEHKKAQEQESLLVETDRKKDGLFKGCFKDHDRPRFPHFIHDHSDDVDRCPHCTWEMEEGECVNCGYPYMSDVSFSDISTETGLPRTLGRAELGEVNAALRDSMESDSYDGYEDDDDSDMGSSMDGFVVNEIENRHPSPRISRWRETSGSESGTQHPSFLHVDSSIYSDTSSVRTHSRTASGRDTRSPPRRSSRRSTGSLDSENIQFGLGFGSTASSPPSSEDDSSISTQTASRRHLASNMPRAPEVDDESETSSLPVRRRPSRANRRVRQQSTPSTDRPPPVVLISSDSDDGPILPRSRHARLTRRQRAGLQRRSPRNQNNDIEAPAFPSQIDNTEALEENMTSRPRDAQPSRGPQGNSSHSQRVVAARPQRESVNMPGAFPPSFTFSEQGGSQLPPPAGRATRSNIEPTPNLTNQGADESRARSHSRDSSPQVTSRNSRGRPPRGRVNDPNKEARKAEHRRRKAELEARRRSQAGPSMAPPLAPH